MADTTTTPTSLSFASSLTNTLGAIGLSALNNQAINLKGKYETELAKIATLQQTNLAQYTLEKAKLDATYGAQNDAIKAKAKRQLIAIIISGVVVLAAVVFGMIILFRKTR